MIHKGIKTIVGVLLIASILLYLNNNTNLVAAFGRVSMQDLVILLVLSILALILLGLQFKTLSSMFSIRLRFREWFGLTSINAMLNLAVPAKAGLLVRGVYLKKRYNFPFGNYAKLLISSHMVAIGFLSLAGLGLLLYITSINAETKLRLFLFFSCILISLIIIVCLAPKYSTRIHSLRVRAIFQVIHVLPVLSKGSVHCWMIFVFAMIFLNLVWAIKLSYCFGILAPSPEFANILLIQCLVGLSLVVSITPGNLGIKEAVTAIGASLLGLPAETALIASLIDRATSVLVIFFFGVFFSFLLNRELRSPVI